MYDHDYATIQIKRAVNPFRAFIKNFYLQNVLKHIQGPSIDYGCGAGQLLEKLPYNSIGVELNPILIDYLKNKGLDIIPANNDLLFSEFKLFEINKFGTLILSHVLEHFENANLVLVNLFKITSLLNINRVIIVVPGIKGYLSDETHKTFIDYEYLKENNLLAVNGYSITKCEYFPVNLKFLSKLTKYHELVLIYDKK